MKIAENKPTLTINARYTNTKRIILCIVKSACLPNITVIKIENVI